MTFLTLSLVRFVVNTDTFIRKLFHPRSFVLCFNVVPTMRLVLCISSLDALNLVGIVIFVENIMIMTLCAVQERILPSYIGFPYDD